MSTPENPFQGAEPLPPEPQTEAPARLQYTGVTERFPVWTLADVLKVTGVVFVSLFFTSLITFLVVAALPAFKNVGSAQIATDARIVVPAQGLAYAITVWFIYRMLAQHYGVPFFESLHWRWPRNWMLPLIGGVVLSVLVQMISSRLPFPKQLPIDMYFRHPLGAWFMAVFGTLVAPVAEELYFRGLLYPSLVRRAGFGLSVVFTSLLFALIHSSQLGSAWAPVLVLFFVGLALTLTRALSGSLATAVLVHVGYNGTIFALMYFATKGFNNFEKLAR